jgi:hypothetical protein
MSAQSVEPAPGSAMSAPRRRSVTWYYRGPDVAVTNQYLLTSHVRYELAELAELGVARGPVHPAVLISSVIAIAQTPIVIPVVAMVMSPMAILFAAILLVVPCVVAIVSARRWPPRMELQANYRGRELVLFSSHDEREFGQVSRAVRRAVEGLPMR